MNKEVRHRRRRSLNIAVEWPEDPQTRGGTQPLHMQPRWTLGKLPKLMLGRAPPARKTDPLLVRTRAEEGNQERKALAFRRIPTFYGPAAVHSKGREVIR